MQTNSETTPFARNNNVTIKENSSTGTSQIITITPLENNIRF
jgi:hypothetical protein